jgi:hypothetical protein
MTPLRTTGAPGQCPRCGMQGQHANPFACIDALRDRLAVLSFEREGARNAAPGHKETRGGRHPRHDNKFLILDGQQLCLSEAARRLDLSPSALHFRMLARTGTREYSGTDVRAVRADVRFTRIEASRAAHAVKACMRTA